MNRPQEFPELTAGMPVVSDDGLQIGEVREVFRELGSVETFGAVGIRPEQKDEGFDPTRYAYSEAMPGAGDDYFTVRQHDGTVLYIPFSHLMRTDGGVAVLAIDAESIPSMNWKVRPDALTSAEREYPEDTGADPWVA
jgi:hypothetical protein